MSGMNPGVDQYFEVGCGRCPRGGTPDCSALKWEKALRKLRAIALECGLTEEVKWGNPCYTVGKKNVMMLGAFRDNCVISFFKGALLEDPDGLLQKPGESSQAARVVRFTEPAEVTKRKAALQALIQQAIDAEKAGKKVETAKNAEPMPEELVKKLAGDPELKAAFEALTPGRQRGYILHFSQAKQSATREARIEKCRPKILEGKGFFD